MTTDDTTKLAVRLLGASQRTNINLSATDARNLAIALTEPLADRPCEHAGTPWCIVHRCLWVGPFDRCEAIR